MKIIVDGLSEVKNVKYLGSVVQNNGRFKNDVKHMINIRWMKQEETLSILYDKIIPIWLKGKYYIRRMMSKIINGCEC